MRVGDFLKAGMVASSSLIALVCGVPLAAHAQEGTAPEVESAEAVDEILVTARRREEAIQDVPVAVSVLSGEAVERAGVTNIQGLQNQTPGLTISGTHTQRNSVALSLRGQRSNGFQLTADPPVGAYFAEVIQPRSYGFGNSFFDLQSIQVVKGVQGTLFGRNMTGGAVLVEPNRPELGVLGGEIKASYGNFDYKELYGQINIPIGDEVALRFAGKIRRRDGWAHDVRNNADYDNQHHEAFRVSLLVEQDEFESLTIFDHYRQRERGTASFIQAYQTGGVLASYEGAFAAGRIASNLPAQFAANRAQFERDRYSFIGRDLGSNFVVYGLGFDNVTSWGLTNKTQYVLNDNITLKNIAGYRKSIKNQMTDIDGLPAVLIDTNEYADIGQFSNEFQIQGNAMENRLTYILGVYYFRESGSDGAMPVQVPEITFLGAGVPQTSPGTLFRQNLFSRGYTKSLAGFAAATFSITDQLKLSGGYRYTYDKRSLTVSPTRPGTNSCLFDVDLVATGVQSVPVPQCFFTGSLTAKKPSYDVTLQYEPSSAVTVYASYRHGFRAGGLNARATNYPALPFGPETVDEFEIGLKTDFPIGQVRLTTATALYYQDYKNVQKSRGTAYDATGDGVPDTVLTLFDNTAKQRNRGLEFEAAAHFPFGLTLNGYFAYTDVDIKKGRVISGGLLEDPMRGITRYQAGAAANYQLPLAEEAGDANLNVTYSYRGRTNLDDFGTQGIQKAYSLINARAEWNDIRRSGISVAAFVNNLTNKAYLIGGFGGIDVGFGFFSGVYGEPRMYGLEVGYTF